MFQSTSIFRILFAAAFAFIVNFANAATPLPAPLDEDVIVTLRAGTAVSLTLNETFTADEVAVGNAIDFMVRSNVTVNGKVVIAAGSIAEGWVKKVNGPCDGSCKGRTSITITVESVQAVDGQRIYLRSIPHTIKAPCCYGAQASAVIGTNLSARVLNDNNIDA